MERPADGPRALVAEDASTTGHRPGGTAPGPDRRALDRAVFAVATVPADLERLRVVVVSEVAALVPRAVASLELADSARGQEVLRLGATAPDPLHLVLPVRADGMVVARARRTHGRSRCPRPRTDDVRRLGEVVGRRVVDAVHGTPQERATVEALRTREHQLLAAQRMASITVWHWNGSARTRSSGSTPTAATSGWTAWARPRRSTSRASTLTTSRSTTAGSWRCSPRPGSAEVELRYRWEDGWRNWYLWAESVADERGVVQSLWGTTQDVTAAARGRGGDPATGRDRLADRAGQPAAPAGPARARAASRPRRVRPAAAGPGPVQDRQRHPRAPGRRPAAGRARAAAGPFAREGGRSGGSVATSSSSSIPGGSLASAQDAGPAGDDRGRASRCVVRGHAAPLATRASIGIAATRRRAGITRQRPLPRGRHRAVRRQGRRPGPHRGVRRRAGPRAPASGSRSRRPCGRR